MEILRINFIHKRLNKQDIWSEITTSKKRSLLFRRGWRVHVFAVWAGRGGVAFSCLLFGRGESQAGGVGVLYFVLFGRGACLFFAVLAVLFFWLFGQ